MSAPSNNPFKAAWEGLNEERREKVVAELNRLRSSAKQGVGAVVKYSCDINSFLEDGSLLDCVREQYSINSANVRKRLHDAAILIEGPEFEGLTEENQNRNIRTYYNELATELAIITIPQLRESGMRLEDIAKVASAMRTCAAIDSRGLMTNPQSIRDILAREMVLYGNPAGATYGYLRVTKEKTDEEIIESASRVNAAVNRGLGVSGLARREDGPPPALP